MPFVARPLIGYCRSVHIWNYLCVSIWIFAGCLGITCLWSLNEEFGNVWWRFCVRFFQVVVAFRNEEIRGRNTNLLVFATMNLTSIVPKRCFFTWIRRSSSTTNWLNCVMVCRRSKARPMKTALRLPSTTTDAHGSSLSFSIQSKQDSVVRRFEITCMMLQTVSDSRSPLGKRAGFEVFFCICRRQACIPPVYSLHEFSDWGDGHLDILWFAIWCNFDFRIGRDSYFSSRMEIDIGTRKTAFYIGPVSEPICLKEIAIISLRSLHRGAYLPY